MTCQDLGNSHLDVYVALERTRQRVLGFGKEREGEWFTATHRMIEQRAACGTRTIQRCLVEMEKAGIVEVQRSMTRAKDGTIKNEPNNYRLPWVGYLSDKLTDRGFEGSHPHEQAVSPPISTEVTKNEPLTVENLADNKKKRRKKKENTLSEEECESILSLFNEVCVSLPPAKELTEGRKTLLSSRLGGRENALEVAREAFAKAEGSDFLTGRDRAAKRTFDFDWLMKENNFTRVLEGTFDDKSAPPKEETPWPKQMRNL